MRRRRTRCLLSGLPRTSEVGFLAEVRRGSPGQELPVSRFVDHIPYYRREQTNARAGVHTPRSRLAA
jgi:hypothetical protein